MIYRDAARYGDKEHALSQTCASMLFIQGQELAHDVTLEAQSGTGGGIEDTAPAPVL